MSAPFPAGSIPAGSIPAGSIPAGSINLPATRFGAVLLSDISPLADIVNCVATDCVSAGKTLTDAYNAHAIQPTATIARLLADIPASNPAHQITIGELIAGMLNGGDFPWDNISLQGLQDVVGTGKFAHYHVDFDFECGISSTFSLSVKLPDGFFPVTGTSTYTYGQAPPVTGSEPTATDPENRFTFKWVPPNPCGDSTAATHVRLDFSAYPGLTLGEQRTSATLSANGLSLSAVGQAPLTVTQNNEPNNDSATAPIIAKDTLIVEHLADASDVDWARFPITGLAPLTRVTATLTVPDGADFDVGITKPAGTSFQPVPAGSIPAGSIPVEDPGQVFDNTKGALPPETLQDVPAAVPAGSIPAGSIGANRGSVTEHATVVLHGESGFLNIGVSGYNGSHSNSPTVLGVKVTPPPPLPPCPARTFPNPTPAANGLPASLPTATRTLFLVNRQRLVALYGATATNALLASIGDQLTPGAFAARPEVRGSVLQVDGNAGVRNAYSAWDANPCLINGANNVVTSINGVVGSYRTQPGGLPNLTYVVLLGTDEALPMFRQNDLTTSSPELDQAGDLAFTTSGLTKGNALYASAAQDHVLTDGAYGALTKLLWPGHDLPLAQLSVARLVETPDDMRFQIQQYVSPTVNGILNPTSATTTGYDFLQEGATSITNSIASNFAGISRDDLLPAVVPIWDRIALLGHYFNKAIIPSIGALNAHYSHYLLQPQTIPPPVFPPGPSGMVTTADVPSGASLASRILFTMGCHAGLNVPDTLGGDPVKLKDWAQAYAQARAAVYVANTGFGYGETTKGLSGLSEQLMANFAARLNSDGKSIGEQWAGALSDYYLSPGAYDVYDEKVMLEATFYGLPFYHFANPGTAPAPTPPATHDDGDGLQVASMSVTPNATETTLGDGRSFWSVAGRTQNTIYRPVQPLVSKDVTVPGLSATGAFMTSLTVSDHAGQKPVQAYPVVDLSLHETTPGFPNIFFPASIVKLERTKLFGAERDSLVVTAGQFRPDAGTDHGNERIVVSASFDVAYSNGAGAAVAPLISQVGAVMTSSTTATIFLRATDSTGPLHKVAALYNDGVHNWQFVLLTSAGGDLYTANVASLAGPIDVFGQAQGHFGVVASSTNKAVNFTAINVDNKGPEVFIDSPVPNASFSLNQKVPANYACSDAGGVASCIGTVADGAALDTSTPGHHDFMVTGTDLSGNTTTKTASYNVGIWPFRGFLWPVKNPPVMNIRRAGRIVLMRFSLGDDRGLGIIAPGYPKTAPLNCNPPPPVPPESNDDEDGSSFPSGLYYIRLLKQYIYVWKTDPAWAGTCKQFILKLTDGSEHVANFRFRAGS